MRIVQLTPGAGGGFYCENCLRDAGLVGALRRAGHDVLMVPMYLPLTADHAGQLANAPLFFGGINVYLQQKLRLFRRTPRWVDRLLDSPRLLGWAARRAGMTHAEDLAETTLSMLRGTHGHQAKELRRLLDYLAAAEKPDVVCLSNALLLGLAGAIRRELGAPVVCTLQDEDIFLDELGEPYSRKTWDAVAERAADVDAFIAVSDYYRQAMIERLRLPRQKVHVVYTGLDATGYGPAPAAPQPPAVGFLERMCEDKGLDILLEAFVLLKSRPGLEAVKLRFCGGKMPEDEPFLDRCRARIAEALPAGDVEFLEPFDRDSRIALLRSLSVLCVPARHKEAFGLYVLEALACGVPAVLPPSGAFPELLAATGGGILAERNDAKSLAAGLETLLRDPDRAAAMGRAGRAAVLEKFSVERMASDYAAVCRAAVGKSAAGPQERPR